MSLMAHINRQWRRVIDRRLQPLGLTQATWLPLLHLARASQAMRQKDLAASLSLDSSSVVRLLDGLEAAGLVERCEGTDRRAKTIHLTTLGLSTVKRVEELVGETREDILSGVPARELEKAFGVLEQVAEALASAQESAHEETPA
ncbi:MAG: MarR family transcriptional regulator [Rhodoferax sp.]|nr:MarR family transcriptional regulator [Rhodoferax sp.]